MRRQIPPACASLGVAMTKGRRNRAVVRALIQRPRRPADRTTLTRMLTHIRALPDSIRRHVKVHRVGGHSPGLDVDLNQSEDREIFGGDGDLQLGGAYEPSRVRDVLPEHDGIATEVVSVQRHDEGGAVDGYGVGVDCVECRRGEAGAEGGLQIVSGGSTTQGESEGESHNAEGANHWAGEKAGGAHSGLLRDGRHSTPIMGFCVSSIGRNAALGAEFGGKQIPLASVALGVGRQWYASVRMNPCHLESGRHFPRIAHEF